MPKISNSYLFLYNSLQSIGCSTTFHAAQGRQFLSTGNRFLSSFNELGLHPILFLRLSFCRRACLLQSIAFLEVIHGALGIVPSGALLPLMQWGGRIHYLLAILHRIYEVQGSASVFVTFSMWSLGEVIRYSHYALNCTGSCPYWMTYIRYTAFILVYPIGLCGEMWLMYHALPFIKEKNLYADVFAYFPFTYYNFVQTIKPSTVGGSDKEDVIDEGGYGGSDEWAEPVDPMVVPGPADHSWPKGHSRVHGCTVKGPTDQDVGTNDETDCERCDDPDVALLRTVYTRPKVITISNTNAFHTVTPDERENADVVCNNKMKTRQVFHTKTNWYQLVTDNKQCRSSIYQTAGGKLEEQASDDRAKALGDPVKNGPSQGDVTANKGTECDGRVDMATGDVCTNRDRHEQAETVSQSCSHQASWRGRPVIRQLI
ncbi:hypothetical protein V2J09_019056 [Rumex salicifolius]